MSDQDDPFGLSNDAGRTRIRPVKSNTPATTPVQPTFGGGPPPPTQGYGGQSGGQYGGQGFGGQSFNTPPQDFGQAGSGPKPRLTRANANPLIVAFASLWSLRPSWNAPCPRPMPRRCAAPGTADRCPRQRRGHGRADDPRQSGRLVRCRADRRHCAEHALGRALQPHQPLVVGLSGE